MARCSYDGFSREPTDIRIKTRGGNEAEEIRPRQNLVECVTWYSTFKSECVDTSVVGSGLNVSL